GLGQNLLGLFGGEEGDRLLELLQVLSVGRLLGGLLHDVGHLLHDRRVGAFREGHDVGLVHGDVEALFLERRHVTQHGVALGVGLAQCDHLTALHVVLYRTVGDGAQIEAAAQHADNTVGYGATVDHLQLGAGEFFQHQALDVGEAAHLGAIGDAARVGFGLVDQVFHAGHAGLLGGDEHGALVDASDAGNVEGLVAVFGQAGHFVDDQLARVGEQDGVAIRRSAFDLFGRQGAAAASDVGHYHGLAGDLVEVLGHHAGVEVGIATG